MKVALFGAGRIGPLHARTLLAPRVRSTGCSSWTSCPSGPRRPPRSSAARPCRSVDEALAGADAVIICASTDDHPGLIRAAIARGLPTFCEKPLAASLEDSIAVRADIEASGVPFQLGFQRRFDPAYVEARRLIESWRPRRHPPAVPAQPRPGACLRGVHRLLGRHVPRPLHPRPGHPALRLRPRGRRGLSSSARRRASRSTRSTTTSPTPWPSCGSTTTRRWR